VLKPRTISNGKDLWQPLWFCTANHSTTVAIAAEAKEFKALTAGTEDDEGSPLPGFTAWHTKATEAHRPSSKAEPARPQAKEIQAPTAKTEDGARASSTAK